MDVIDVPRLPVAFQYFEVRPVLNVDGGCISFTDEAEFEAERDRLRADDADVEAIWMIFGIDKQGIGHAVGDYVHKDSAHRLMQAILAPMIGALEELDAGSVHNAKGEEMRDRIVTAAALLEDFVNQCSNEERI